MEASPAKSIVEQKKTNLFFVLSGIFITNAVVAELIGAKLFSLEQSLGIAEAQISLLGEGPFSFTLTAGVILWPVVFVSTDIINEYFGKSGVRKVSFFTAGMIAYMFVVIWMVTKLVPSPFWIENYPDLNISEAFNAIFLQGLGIIVGSLVAFLIGQFTDVYVFQWLRKFTGSQKIWLRATGSTLISQLIDSFVVLFIAFYLFNNYSFTLVIAIGCVNYIYKFLVAIALTPLLYVAHYLIDKYLGVALSEQMTAEASESELF